LRHNPRGLPAQVDARIQHCFCRWIVAISSSGLARGPLQGNPVRGAAGGAVRGAAGGAVRPVVRCAVLPVVRCAAGGAVRGAAGILCSGAASHLVRPASWFRGRGSDLVRLGAAAS
jgi:hypothetical protein